MRFSKWSISFLARDAHFVAQAICHSLSPLLPPEPHHTTQHNTTRQDVTQASHARRPMSLPLPRAHARSVRVLRAPPARLARAQGATASSLLW